MSVAVRTVSLLATEMGESPAAFVTYVIASAWRRR